MSDTRTLFEKHLEAWIAKSYESEATPATGVIGASTGPTTGGSIIVVWVDDASDEVRIVEAVPADSELTLHGLLNEIMSTPIEGTIGFVTASQVSPDASGLLTLAEIRRIEESPT